MAGACVLTVATDGVHAAVRQVSLGKRNRVLDLAPRCQRDDGSLLSDSPDGADGALRGAIGRARLGDEGPVDVEGDQEPGCGHLSAPAGQLLALARRGARCYSTFVNCCVQTRLYLCPSTVEHRIGVDWSMLVDVSQLTTLHEGDGRAGCAATVG